MKILFISKEIPFPPVNGGRMRCWNIMKLLASRHELLCVCFGDNASLPEEVSRMVKVVCVPPEVHSQSRWRNYLRLLSGVFYRYPWLVRSKMSQEMRDTLGEIIQQQGVDLIFCDSVYYAVNVSLCGRKAVLNEHNLESKLLERTTRLRRNPVARFILKDQLQKFQRYEEETWARFHRVFMCSSVDAQEAGARLGQGRFSVVPNGVDVDFFSPAPQRPLIPAKLSYTAEMGWYPNEDAVLFFVHDIYPLIKEKVLEVSFDIIGKNPGEKVRQLAAADRSLNVTGFVDDVRPYVQQSRVFVVPLRIGSGTRLKILEAMAMGKAVVSTSVGAEGIDVTDGKDILIADDPADFADKVVDLLNHPDKAQALGVNGRKLVETKYSWEIIGQRIEQEIQEVMHED